MSAFSLKIFLAGLFLHNVFSIKLTIPEAKSGIITARLNQDIQFTCEHDAISQPSESINWYAPSSPTESVIQTDNKKKIFITWDSLTDRKRLTLTIRQFQSSDVGEYYCKYIVERGNRKEELDQTFVTLLLTQPIESTSCSVEQWILDESNQVDSRGTIRCQVNGIPAPIVSWYFNNKLLSTSLKYLYRSYGLDIINPSKSDAGVYTIKAIQEGNSDIFMRDIVLRVFEKPRIIFGPKVIAPVQGAAINTWDATLRCLAEGDPMPTVHWYRAKNPTQELPYLNPQKFFTNTNPKFGLLQIMRASYPEDDGTYICRASVTSPAIDFMKEDMYTEASVNVTVYVMPVFTNWDRMNAATDLGGTVTVMCRVFATDPVMQFQKWGFPVYVNGRQPDDNRIFVRQFPDVLTPMYHNLELTISNARFEDSWNYTCIATNVAANYSMNATIHVYQKPNMSLNVEENYFGWYNNATNLTCISLGLPHPQWTWYRNLVPVLNNVNETFHIITFDYERSSQSWLQIKPRNGMERWIFGEYRCNATNVKGTDSHTVWFRDVQIPGPPVVSIQRITSSSVEFFVRANNLTGGRGIDQFEVSYQGSTGWTAFYGPVIFPPHDPQLIRLEGLMPGSSYTFQFQSRNIRGLSYPSTIMLNTEGPTPPGAIEIVSPEVSAYPYSYFIQWKMPLTGGSPIRGYKITVQRVTLDPVTKSVQYRGEAKDIVPWFINPNMREYRINDLLPDTDYIINVQAFSDRGYSPLNEQPFIVHTAPEDFLGVPPRVRGISIPRQAARSIFVYLLIVYLTNICTCRLF